jgi:hypothetical protein
VREAAAMRNHLGGERWVRIAARWRLAVGLFLS